MGKTFGRKHGGKDWKTKAKIDSGGRLPYFLTANNIKPFIIYDLSLLGFDPIKYKLINGSIGQ
jgi:hypothetical protein